MEGASRGARPPRANHHADNLDDSGGRSGLKGRLYRADALPTLDKLQRLDSPYIGSSPTNLGANARLARALGGGVSRDACCRDGSSSPP